MEIPTFRFALREDLKNDKQFLPTRGEPKATGWDVRVATPNREQLVIKPGEYVKLDLGLRAFCPEGFWYELKPRSSTFAKKYMHSLYGTIDETFENFLIFAAKYDPPNNENLILNFGDAIGQIVPVRRQEMEVVEITNEDYDNACKARVGVRGTNGWGSTG